MTATFTPRRASSCRNGTGSTSVGQAGRAKPLQTPGSRFHGGQGRHRAGGHAGTVHGAEHLDVATPSPRRPRTSTRTAPGPPSGCGGRSMGSRAVSRSRRVAASRAVTRLDAGEGRHEEQGVGQRGPVAVVGTDGIGEPAQLAARAGRAPHPAAVAPVDRRLRRATRGAGGRRPGRRCPARATWISSTSSKPAAARRARTQVSPGENAAPTTTRHAPGLGLGTEVEEAGTSAMASEVDTTGTARPTSDAGLARRA